MCTKWYAGIPLVWNTMCSSCMQRRRMGKHQDCLLALHLSQWTTLIDRCVCVCQWVMFFWSVLSWLLSVQFRLVWAVLSCFELIPDVGSCQKTDHMCRQEGRTVWLTGNSPTVAKFSSFFITFCSQSTVFIAGRSQLVSVLFQQVFCSALMHMWLRRLPASGYLPVRLSPLASFDLTWA